MVMVTNDRSGESYYVSNRLPTKKSKMWGAHPYEVRKDTDYTPHNMSHRTVNHTKRASRGFQALGKFNFA